MKNVLKEAGLAPDPVDHPDTWSDFLKRHAAVMWQCDFACNRKRTVRGMVDLYFLVFIHIGTRRIWVSPCTTNPSGEWTAQQARNFDLFLHEEEPRCTVLQRDHDTKYVKAFDDVFTGEGREIKTTIPKSPNLQAFVERVIQTLKPEVLSRRCVIFNQASRQTVWLFKLGLPLRGIQSSATQPKSGAPLASLTAIESGVNHGTPQLNFVPFCRLNHVATFLYRARLTERVRDAPSPLAPAGG